MRDPSDQSIETSAPSSRGFLAQRSIQLAQSQARLLERERLAAIGEFTTMIVHEIRNPLTTILLGLKHAHKVSPANGDQERIALALSECQRLNRLLDEALDYARPPLLRLVELDISEFLAGLLDQILKLPAASERQIRLVCPAPQLVVWADAQRLRQVFLNLFINACEAIDPGETIRYSVRNDTDTERVCVKIYNGGQPIPAELLSRIATPFVSTKPSGSGLGLAISQRIIHAHGGELKIASSSSGTTVSMYLPSIPSTQHDLSNHLPNSA
jgi:signal transduction histidine kinase